MTTNHNTRLDRETALVGGLSMAQIGGEDNRNELLVVLQKGKKALEKPWAALALGVLGSPRASKALQDVLQDNTAGRQLTGGKTQDLVRAFSALSLGLIGDEEAHHYEPSVVFVNDKNQIVNVGCEPGEVPDGTELERSGLTIGDFRTAGWPAFRP